MSYTYDPKREIGQDIVLEAFDPSGENGHAYEIVRASGDSDLRKVASHLSKDFKAIRLWLTEECHQVYLNGKMIAQHLMNGQKPDCQALGKPHRLLKWPTD